MSDDDFSVSGVLSATGGFIGAAALVAASPILAGVLLATAYQEGSFARTRHAKAKTKATTDELQRLLELKDLPDTEGFAETTARIYCKLIEDRQIKLPAGIIFIALIDAAQSLYATEGLNAAAAPPSSVLTDTIEAARYRDLLNERIAKLSDPEKTIEVLIVPILNAFIKFTELLPPLAQQSWEQFLSSPDDDAQPDFQVTLIDLIPDVGAAVQALILPFFAPQVIERRLHSAIREQLERNQHRMSGVPFTGEFRGSSKLVMPRDHRGTAREIVDGYLQGTPLHLLFDAPIPFTIPQQARFEHQWVVAGTGHGKTQTLQTLIGRDLEAVAKGEASVVVLDSQGDLIKNIAGLKLFAEGQPLHGKLCLIDPTDIEFPVQLNLFSLGTERLDSYSKLDRERLLNSIIELYDFVLAALLGAEMTSKQSIIFRFVTRALLQIPNATVHTLLELMEPGGDQKYKQYISKLQGAAQSFFANEFNSAQFAETKRQVLRRLYGVLENQTFERMFSHPKNKLDIFKEMNSGKVILINAAKDLLKQNGTEIFGRFFIALIAQAAAERATLSPNQRLPTFVYIDECQDYIATDSNFTVILEQARKQKIGLIVAHQYLSQLSQSTLDSLHANTSIKFAGGVSDRDAHALARNMRTTAEFIENQSRLSFAAYVRNFTLNAVSLSIEAGYLENKERMTEKEMDALRDQMRAQYAVPIAEAHQIDSEPPEATGKPEDFSDSY